MTFITTIESIMTTQLYTWNPDEQSKEDVVKYATDKLFDTVPVRRNGRIDGLFYVSTGQIERITHDLLLTRDTPIPDALELLSASHHPALLVLYRQQVEGILTPSDFNKVMARSYFYNLLAQLEMRLADHVRAFYRDENQLVAIIKPNDKTVPQYRKKIRERSSSDERKKYALDLIHSLMLSELQDLIFKDVPFCERLGFVNLEQAQRLFTGINDEFRRKVMHPTRPLLSDTIGIEQLSQYFHQVVELINLLERANIKHDPSIPNV
jgi:hypothetical protein